MELLQQAQWGDLDRVKTLIQQGVHVDTKNRCSQTALYFACENGHADVVQYLLENGANVSLGAKPLIAAVRNDHYECCTVLLEHHASVRCRNSKGESPMSVAVQKHHYSIILLLLQYGAMLSASLKDVAFQLLKCAKAEHAKVVQKMIDQNVINLTLENIFLAALGFAFKHGSIELAERMLSNDSYSKIDQLYPDAVYYSAKNNWPTILSKLFEKRMNINALTDGQTPLYAACKEGHETVVTLLLNNGADPNMKNECRVTASNDFLFPLQTAVHQGNVAICDMLLEKGSKLDQPGEPLLHIACSTATIEWKTDEAAETRSADQMLSTIRLLLQHGVDVNALSDKGDTAVYCACTGQQLEMVRILVEAGADVDRTSSRRYPLIAACDAGNVELINMLISAGADVKCSNISNETCLHVLINACSSTTYSQKPAVGVSKIDIVSGIKSLLEVGADANARCSQEETALYRASKAGHEDIVRLLLDADADSDGSNNCRPLYAACERGYTKIVDILLQHGADSNASSTPSSSPGVPMSFMLGLAMAGLSSLPICCAVHKGYTEIVKLLLTYGADVNKRDQLGKSAMMYVVESLTAQRRKPLEVLNPLSEEMGFSILKSFLLTGGDVNVCSEHDGLSPLHVATTAGMCDLMMELIQHGANCNQLTFSGVSAVDLACKHGHEAALEMLLKNGAKLDGKTGYKSHSMSPLCMAAKSDSETMVKMLLQYGADTNASSEKGDTALHLATSYAIIESLLNAKANINATNDSGKTALSVVCEKRQADTNVVELLLKFGADPNIGCPLHVACKKNYTDIVKLLLAYGADANLMKMSERLAFVPRLWGPFLVRDKDVELSPLCVACRNGNVAIVDCLLKNGANAAFADSDGNTALHFAVERLQDRLEQQANLEEYDPIVTLLLQHDTPVNVVSSKGETPLYVACMKGLAGVIKQLLDCRADVSLTTTKSSKYPLLIACEKRFRDVAIQLLDRGADANVSRDDETPLKLASANGDAELVKQLLRSGADVNQMQGISDTALHVVVVFAGSRRCFGNRAFVFVDIVQRLLKSGAGPNALNHKHETPLCLACRPTDGSVHVDIVQALLERGADPNVGLHLPYERSLSQPSYSMHNVDDLPPLLAASSGGNTALVILLMRYGATVDRRTGLGRTALHYASNSTKSNTSTAEVLLSAGADANAVDITGASPLYLACERGRPNTQLVQLLLSRGANPNTGMKATGKYPMHAACRAHNYDLVKLLLEYDADVDVCDDRGKTALHYTCDIIEYLARLSSESVNKRILDLVQLLLDRGADVNVASTDGETPFYVACSKGLTSVVAKMLEYGAKVDGHGGVKPPLNVACRNKHLPLVQLLLSYGANPDLLEVEEENRYRRTLPLHIAAADGNSELVELLLKHGSNIGVTDIRGSTALHYGIEKHESRATSHAKSVVDILLENRADVNILNDSGETPLYTAVSRGLLDVVRKMLQTYGGNPNTSSTDKNALVAACKRRNVELVDVLLKNGADPNLANLKCRLPLCTAVTQGNSDEIIILLMNAGANVNALDRDSKTALCIATENMTNRCRYQTSEVTKKLISTIRLLLEHGANLNVLMPDGRSPLGLVVSAIGVPQRRECRAHLIELLQLMVKLGAILSADFFSVIQQNTSRQLSLHGMLRDHATFDGKHEFIVDLFRAGAGFQLIASCCTAVAARPGEATSIRLCQAAVIAGYSSSTAEIQQLQLAAASEDANGGLLDQLVNWLNEDRQQVPSLSRQCRVVIRRQLSLAVNHRSILTAIDTLPLPNSMKMYLQFEGMLTEVDLSVEKELYSEETSAESRHQTVSSDSSEYDGYGSDFDDFCCDGRDYDDYDSSDNDCWNYDSDDDYPWWLGF